MPLLLASFNLSFISWRNPLRFTVWLKVLQNVFVILKVQSLLCLVTANVPYPLVMSNFITYSFDNLLYCANTLNSFVLEKVKLILSLWHSISISLETNSFLTLFVSLLESFLLRKDFSSFYLKRPLLLLILNSLILLFSSSNYMRKVYKNIYEYFIYICNTYKIFFSSTFK